jgi:hypothetical protein
MAAWPRDSRLGTDGPTRRLTLGTGWHAVTHAVGQVRHGRRVQQDDASQTALQP